MSKFAIGQRVRLAYLHELSLYESEGSTGTIVELEQSNGDDYRVLWDSDPLGGYTYSEASLVAAS